MSGLLLRVFRLCVFPAAGAFPAKRRRALLLLVALLSALFLLGLGRDAAAHRLAPSYLELREAPQGRVTVLWRTPVLASRRARPTPELPCVQSSEPAWRSDAGALIGRWELDCGAQALTGLQLAVDGLAESGTDALVHIRLANGRTLRTILTARQPRMIIPERERTGAVTWSYFRFGVEHLATGLDHVLFILGITALIGWARPLVFAITAFTLGHSLTLSLQVLGLAGDFPAAAVELAIAASLVLPARELALADADADKETRAALLLRYPGLVTFAFGLLHGLGFAGALTELGLPESALPAALLGFNLGIEAGQLALMSLALLVLAAARRAPRVSRRLLAGLATLLGGFGMYLLLSRSAEWLVGG